MTVFDTETKDISFYWFPRLMDKKYPISNKAVDLLPKDIINIVPYITSKNVENNYTEEQIFHLSKANELMDIIIKEISKFEEKCEIRIEGFSYGSISRSTIDLIMYQSILRYRLWNLGKHDLKIFTPSFIKKSFTGKGNSNKLKMIETFSQIKSENLSIKGLQNSLDNKTINIKPYDDIIDSFALTQIEI